MIKATTDSYSLSPHAGRAATDRELWARFAIASLTGVLAASREVGPTRVVAVSCTLADLMLSAELERWHSPTTLPQDASAGAKRTETGPGGGDAFAGQPVAAQR